VKDQRGLSQTSITSARNPLFVACLPKVAKNICIQWIIHPGSILSKRIAYPIFVYKNQNAILNIPHD
jgi:hypothetical protein